MRSDGAGGGGSVAGSSVDGFWRTVEFTNSTGVSVDCDWTSVNQRRMTSANDQKDGGGGPVADGASHPDGISLTWLDASRQPVASVAGLRYPRYERKKRVLKNTSGIHQGQAISKSSDWVAEVSFSVADPGIGSNQASIC